jgi:hypothetical protein
MLTLITPPEAAPISLAEIRSQCRVDPADESEDALLAQYIRAAASWPKPTWARR